MISKIESGKLQFPKTPVLNENVKDFIVGCLQIEESKRFGWDQVINHKIFKSTPNLNVKSIEHIGKISKTDNEYEELKEISNLNQPNKDTFNLTDRYADQIHKN